MCTQYKVIWLSFCRYLFFCHWNVLDGPCFPSQYRWFELRRRCAGHRQCTRLRCSLNLNLSRAVHHDHHRFMVLRRPVAIRGRGLYDQQNSRGDNGGLHMAATFRRRGRFLRMPAPVDALWLASIFSPTPWLSDSRFVALGNETVHVHSSWNAAFPRFGNRISISQSDCIQCTCQFADKQTRGDIEETARVDMRSWISDHVGLAS